MRKDSTQVEIFLSLQRLLRDGVVCYMSEAGTLLFPDRVDIDCITRVSIADAGTHLYVRPPLANDVGVLGGRCLACQMMWFKGMKFCPNAFCTVALELVAICEELAALPKDKRVARVGDRYGMAIGDLRLPGDALPARGRGVQPTSSPATIAKAGFGASGAFAKAFLGTAASLSKGGKPAGKGQGKNKAQ